jgi:hypothetical protein
MVDVATAVPIPEFVMVDVAAAVHIPAALLANLPTKYMYTTQELTLSLSAFYLRNFYVCVQNLDVGFSRFRLDKID